MGIREIKISDLAILIMKLMDKRFQILDKKSPSASVLRRCPNTKKLYDITGYKATTCLEDGLKITLDWYLNGTLLYENIDFGITTQLKMPDSVYHNINNNFPVFPKRAYA